MGVASVKLLTNASAEKQNRTEFGGSHRVVLYTVTMFPEIPRDVEQLHNQLFDPLLARIVKREAVVVCLLNAAPMIGDMRPSRNGYQPMSF